MRRNKSTNFAFFFGLLLLCCAALPSGAALASGGEPVGEILFEWTTMEFDWESQEQRESYLASGRWLPTNNALAGIKVFQDEIYVTIPRWRPGIPSTLNKVVVKNGTAVLQPFPSWQMQDPMTGLRYVQSMEIDSNGWMWIIDAGRANIFSTPEVLVNGPASLVIYDLIHNCTVRKYVFPDSVVAHDGSFLNDIVIDQVHGYAFISDTWSPGGIIVYDYNNNRSRYYTDSLNFTTQYDPSAVPLQINNRNYTLTAPLDGIALSPDAQTLYYCPLISRHLFSVPVSVISNFNLSNEQIAQQVTVVGAKGYSDGLASSDNGNLYYGELSSNAVHQWNRTQPLSTAQVLISNATTTQWADTFAWDGKGNLLFVSNRLELWWFNEMQFDGDANFRIWRIPVGGNSYLQATKPTYTGECHREPSGGDGLTPPQIIGISVAVGVVGSLLIIGVVVGLILVRFVCCRSPTEESYALVMNT